MDSPNRKPRWALAGLLVLCATACGAGETPSGAGEVKPGFELLLKGERTTTEALRRRAATDGPEAFAAERVRMVDRQIARRGVSDGRVLAAMKRVPRHEYVPGRLRSQAYDDRPLPIGHGQTISQPYIVGYMTEALGLSPGDRVLEVGTGSGYQAATLGELVSEVVTVEIVEPLAREAAARLARLGYDNVTVLRGDGYFGWKEGAPYDAIIVTAAARHVPPPLLEQLKPGGRMIIPVGRSGWTQSLVEIRRDAKGEVHSRETMAVRFVPLTRSR